MGLLCPAGGICFIDNSVCVIGDEEHGVHGSQRRFEVFGTRGSAIIVEPFVPGHSIKLCLDEARGGYAAGEQIVEVTPTEQVTYAPDHPMFAGGALGECNPGA